MPSQIHRPYPGGIKVHRKKVFAVATFKYAHHILEYLSNQCLQPYARLCSSLSSHGILPISWDALTNDKWPDKETDLQSRELRLAMNQWLSAIGLKGACTWFHQLALDSLAKWHSNPGSQVRHSAFDTVAHHPSLDGLPSPPRYEEYLLNSSTDDYQAAVGTYVKEVELALGFVRREAGRDETIQHARWLVELVFLKIPATTIARRDDRDVTNVRKMIRKLARDLEIEY